MWSNSSRLPLKDPVRIQLEAKIYMVAICTRYNYLPTEHDSYHPESEMTCWNSNSRAPGGFAAYDLNDVIIDLFYQRIRNLLIKIEPKRKRLRSLPGLPREWSNALFREQWYLRKGRCTHLFYYWSYLFYMWIFMFALSWQLQPVLNSPCFEKLDIFCLHW